jgi:hypothetical protein
MAEVGPGVTTVKPHDTIVLHRWPSQAATHHARVRSANIA